jgi:hypothetical protein
MCGVDAHRSGMEPLACMVSAGISGLEQVQSLLDVDGDGR